MSVSWLTKRITYPIGIDLCSSGAKLVQLQRRGSTFREIAVARVDLPNLGESEGYRDTRVEQLAETIRRTIDAGRFVGQACVLSLDDRLLRVRSVRQPAMPPEDLNRVMRLEASTRLGYGDQEEAEFGWIIAGEVTQGQVRGDEVILVGGSREPIERIVMGLAREGLRPRAVEPGFLACARSFTRYIRRASEQEDVRAVVDIGLMSTGVMLLRGQDVAFYKPLEIGGQQFAAAAADRLGLEIEAVRDLRRQSIAAGSGLGEQLDPKVDRAMFEAIRPLIGEMAREVALCMRYYSVTFRGSKPRECLVIGGEAATPHLLDVLHEELRIPTMLGEPMRNVQAASGNGMWTPSVGAGGEWSVAAGLSLHPWEMSLIRRRTRRMSKDQWSRRTDGMVPRSDNSERRAA